MRPGENQTFSSPGEALEHHGVKGMRWGHRKKEDTGDGEVSAKPVSVGSSRSSSGRVISSRGLPPGAVSISKSAYDISAHNNETKSWMSTAEKMPKPTTHAELKAALEENQRKSALKLLPDGADTSGSHGSVKERWDSLSPDQKKAIKIGVAGVAAAGALYYLNKQSGNSLLGGVKSEPYVPFDYGKYQKEVQLSGLKAHGIRKLSDIDGLAGAPINPDKFQALVGSSITKTWTGDGYVQASSWTRPEYELPVGTKFFRLSTGEESIFSSATYSTHSIEDFNRYVAGFRSEKGVNATFHKVEWELNEPARIPNLTTVLGTLSDVMKTDSHTPSQEEVLNTYKTLSGGSWKGRQDGGVGPKLLDSLREKGYHAIVDEMDAGVIGESPVVFFGRDVATPKKSTFFDSEAISRAESALKEINNPPGRKY